MAAFNILSVNAECPRCNREAEFEAEFRFGLTAQDRYAVGDRLKWGEKGLGRSRPDKGDFNGPGYVVCPRCDKDFWINIFILEDVITSFSVDTSRKGYINYEDENVP